MIDLPGFVLSGVGIGALVFGIVDGAEAGWTTTNAIVGLRCRRRALLGFVAWELRTPKPMLDVRLFGLRGFSTGTLALTVQFLCLYGFFFVGLQFLQLTLGLQRAVSAAGLLPMAAIVMPMSKVAPQLVDRLGQRRRHDERPAAPRPAVSASCRGWTPDRPTGTSSAGWPCSALGMALTSTPSTTAIVASLPRCQAGVASAMNDVSRELGFGAGHRHPRLAVQQRLPGGDRRCTTGGAPGRGRPRRRGVGRRRARRGVATRTRRGTSWPTPCRARSPSASPTPWSPAR